MVVKEGTRISIKEITVIRVVVLVVSNNREDEISEETVLINKVAVTFHAIGHNPVPTLTKVRTIVIGQDQLHPRDRDLEIGHEEKDFSSGLVLFREIDQDHSMIETGIGQGLSVTDIRTDRDQALVPLYQAGTEIGIEEIEHLPEISTSQNHENNEKSPKVVIETTEETNQNLPQIPKRSVIIVVCQVIGYRRV